MSIQGNNGFLDLENASLRVTGNVHAEGFKVGSVRLQSAYSLQSITGVSNVTNDMIQFTNPTKSFDATSNIEVGNGNLFVNTTTSNVGIGTNMPTSTLDVRGDASVSGNVSVSGVVSVGEVTDFSFGNIPTINFDQVSNVSQIKSNSNVVMEYRRSKKLIKYPRVAMTSASQGGYVVQTSGNNATSNDGWKAFNGVGFNGQTNAGDHWITPDLYTHDTGAFEHASTAIYQPLGTGATGAGAWIAIKLPHKIKLTKLRVDNTSKAGFRDYTIHGRNGGGAIVGGTEWSSALLTVTDEGSGYSQTGNYIFTETSHDITTNDYYEEFIIIITKKTPSSSSLDNFLLMRELQFFGLPEYDPEAHGTDVVLHTTPNVPNTDFSNVYYDGQDYTSMPATVADKSGNGVTGTPSGGVGFDSTYKAFTFDGVDDKITSFLTNPAGAWVHSTSSWFKINSYGSGNAIYSIDNDTTPVANQSPDFSIMPDGDIRYAFGANDIRFGGPGTIVPNKWYHIVSIYSGGSDASSRQVFLNGVELGQTDVYQAAALNGQANMILRIGVYANGSSYLNGSIANFRLYNQALSADEIWELYAYQKEYFGVSPDVVTLKAGRLGIGTSEPRAVLDVRGDIKGGCPVYFDVYKSGSNFTGLVTWNNIRFNKGDGYNPTTGLFTAPISGHYWFHSHVLSVGVCQQFWQINGATALHFSQTNTGSTHLGGSDVFYMNAGDTINVTISSWSAYPYANGFSGFYLSS